MQASAEHEPLTERDRDRGRERWTELQRNRHRFIWVTNAGREQVGFGEYCDSPKSAQGALVTLSIFSFCTFQVAREWREGTTETNGVLAGIS